MKDIPFIEVDEEITESGSSLHINFPSWKKSQSINTLSLSIALLIRLDCLDIEDVQDWIEYSARPNY